MLEKEGPTFKMVAHTFNLVDDLTTSFKLQCKHLLHNSSRKHTRKPSKITSSLADNIFPVTTSNLLSKQKQLQLYKNGKCVLHHTNWLCNFYYLETEIVLRSPQENPQTSTVRREPAMGPRRFHQRTRHTTTVPYQSAFKSNSN